jgi:hypothetical protein
MSGRQPTPKLPEPPRSPPIQPPVKKKVKIRKDKKWVDVDVDEEIRKGRFKYVKFVDDDGLDTYWISPE